MSLSMQDFQNGISSSSVGVGFGSDLGLLLLFSFDSVFFLPKNSTDWALKDIILLHNFVLLVYRISFIIFLKYNQQLHPAKIFQTSLQYQPHQVSVLNSLHAAPLK